MDYLKKYNLSNEDINEIINNIDENDKIEYDVHEENMCKILEYLTKRGLNIKPLLINKSYLFYTQSKVLIDKLNSISNDKLLLINDDVDLIDELV